MKIVNLTADICDEIGDSVIVLPNIFSDFGGRKIFEGEVCTLKVKNDNSLVRELLNEDGKGRILFVDGGGSNECALLGGNLALLGEQNNWAGVIVYGSIRDSQELKSITFGVKALGTNPRRSKKAGRGEKNVAVMIDQKEIKSGDYIFCDHDGIIVVAESFKTNLRDLKK